MSNMAAIISSHDAKILAHGPEGVGHMCNCRRPQDCPLCNQCLTECVVYKATISTDNTPVKHYYGLTEGPFKTRFNNHNRSFRTESFRKEIAFSKYIRAMRALNAL
jgi:hypothetical protein